MKFRGFRASLNFASFKHENSEDVSPVSVTGAYKLKNEEFFGLGSYPEPRRKISPSMVKLPQAFQPDPTDVDVIKASQSTPDLVQAKNLPPNLAKSTPDVSLDPRGRGQITDVRPPNVVDAKAQSKEEKKLEKKRVAEQKKREKLEAQERAKEEKARKQREKLELQEQAKAEKLRKEAEKAEAQRQAKLAKKNPAPIANARNPLARGAGPTPAPTTAGYSTNTLDSSISKSSGPPPYTDQPLEAGNPMMMQNENDDTGNTSFGKPIESGNTWDMINQHRQQISRVPLGAGAKQASGIKQVLRFRLTDDKNESSDNNNEAVTGRKSLYV